MCRFLSSTVEELQSLENIRRMKGWGEVDIEFLMYDPRMKYVNLEIVSFIEAVYWLSDDHLLNEIQKPWEGTGLYLLWAKPGRPKEMRLTRKLRAAWGHRHTLEAFPGFLEFSLIFVFFWVGMGIWKKPPKGKYYKQILLFFVSCW